MSQTISNLLPSLFVDQIASATFGQPVHFITPVDFGTAVYTDIHVTGKATVDGLLDPSGLQLTPVIANPGNGVTIWVDLVNNQPQFGVTNMVIAAPGVTVNEVPAFNSDGVIRNSLITISGNNSFIVPGDIDLAGILSVNQVVPHSGTIVNFQNDAAISGNLQVDNIQRNLAPNITLNSDLLGNNVVIGSTGGAGVIQGDIIQGNNYIPLIGTTLSINSGSWQFDDAAHILSSVTDSIRLTAGSINLIQGELDTQLVKTDSIIPLSTANFDIAGVIDIHGPPVSEIRILSFPLILGDTAVRDTGIADGVLQLQSNSDAGYGTPVASNILYCDSDNIIKSKNTVGNIKSVSALADTAQFWFLGSAAIAISTLAIFTEVSFSFTLDNNRNFDQPANGRLRYIGTRARTLMISGTFSIDSNAVGVQYLECVLVKNATTNVNNEKVSGTNIGSTDTQFSANGGAIEIVNGSFNCLVTATTNDYFSLFFRNVTTSPDILDIQNVSIIVKSISSGTD